MNKLLILGAIGTILVIIAGTVYFTLIIVPPNIPHTLLGKEERCTDCHQIGLSGVGVLGGRGIPDDHDEQTSDSCLTCHEQSESPTISTAEGGLLYDKWWKAVPGRSGPIDDNPVWALQTTNTRNGSDTWRCKECHGWDYQGKDGAYGSGSHYTGFNGILDARTKTIDELLDILRGKTNTYHNFSTVIDDESLTKLAEFIAEGGVIDLTMYLDYNTKKPIGGDIENGKKMYELNCTSCHGKDGNEILFGEENIGSIVNNNPWEFIHKARFGQPGTSMPSGIEYGLSTFDIVDLLAYCQALSE